MLNTINYLASLKSTKEQVSYFRKMTGACEKGTLAALEVANVSHKEVLTFVDILKVAKAAYKIGQQRYVSEIMSMKTLALIDKNEVRRRAILHKRAKKLSASQAEENLIYWGLVRDKDIKFLFAQMEKIKRTVKRMELSCLIDCSIELECGRERKEHILNEMGLDAMGDPNHSQIVIFLAYTINTRIREEGKEMLSKELKSLDFSTLEEIILLSDKLGYFGPSEALTKAVNGACYNRGEYTRLADTFGLHQLATDERASRLSPKPATFTLGDLLK